jgi:hypothetical protein
VNATGGFSVTGGYVYRGTQSPGLTGYYICADFVSGRFWTIRRQGNSYISEPDTLLRRPGISAFGEDAAGEIYYADINAGRIFRLSGTAPLGLPTISAAATLKLWPNPAARECRVELPQAVDAEVEVLNPLTGQVVRRTRANAATAAATLDLQGLAAGLYHVRALLPGGPRTQRLVVVAP